MSWWGVGIVGDAYLILHTDKDSSGKLTYNIYFWIGKDCSQVNTFKLFLLEQSRLVAQSSWWYQPGNAVQDEAGAAAFLSVELDDSLGGAPKQNREVQGGESADFLKVLYRDLHCFMPSGAIHYPILAVVLTSQIPAS